ncbi:MAG: glycosyltransferase, partial [Planctomycetaceae bacterium]|nr:glycosyltransferase [Planctomycetaceae bacterium]
MTETINIAASRNHSGEITVGVTTRNRIGSLRRCLESLRQLSPQLAEVIVVDDASDAPVETELEPQLVEDLSFRIIRQATNEGYIVARNRIVLQAKTDLVLLLDDDTVILDPQAVWTAVETLQADIALGAVAFAQADADGQPWPPGAQPAPVDYACYVPTFIGFAHLLRRDVFLRLGGYRELFHYYGEEKEYCLRALDAGYRVAYLPECLIAHLPDPSGRDPLKYYRAYTRNDCLAALYTLPWPVAACWISLKILLYGYVARKHMGLKDVAGRRWLIDELRSAWPKIRPVRRPVRYRTLALWRRMRSTRPAYHPT